MRVSQILPLHSPDWSFTRAGRGSGPRVKVDRTTVDTAYDEADKKRRQEQERHQRLAAVDLEIQQRKQAEKDRNEELVKQIRVRQKAREEEFSRQFPDVVAIQKKREQAEKEAREKKHKEALLHFARRDAEKQIDDEIEGLQVKLKKLLGGRGIPDEDLVDMMKQKIADLRKKKSSL